MPLASMTRTPDFSASLAVMVSAPPRRRDGCGGFREARAGWRAADVALAPAGHAVAQPVLLGDDLAVRDCAGCVSYASRTSSRSSRNRQSRARRGASRRGRATRCCATDWRGSGGRGCHEQRRAGGARARAPAIRSWSGRDGLVGSSAAGCRVPAPARGRARAARLAAGEVRRVLAAVEAELLQQLAG